MKRFFFFSRHLSIICFRAGKKSPFCLGMAAFIPAAIMLLSACKKNTETNSAAEVISESNTVSSEPTVDLSQSQDSAIKIDRLGTLLFSDEIEAVGNISYEEDPAIVQAEATLVSTYATFEFNQKTLTRTKGLYSDSGGLSQKDLEQAISDEESSESVFKAARNSLRVLGKTDAEINRIIGSGKIDPTRSKDASIKWVLANIIESEIPLVRVGQSIHVQVLAYPDHEFEGKVFRIYSNVDPNTHRMMIRCAIADPKQELLPGMLADLNITVREPQESVAIPANGVVREGDGTLTAWITNDRKRFTQKIIRVGLEKDGAYQVLEGLHDGELVVVDGAVFLSNILNAPPSD